MIAAAEEIRDLDAARRVVQNIAAQLLVLNPMVVGGLRTARWLMELAQATGVVSVVTTTLDARVGVELDATALPRYSGDGGTLLFRSSEVDARN